MSEKDGFQPFAWWLLGKYNSYKKLITSALFFAEFSPVGHVSWQELEAKQIMPRRRVTPGTNMSLNLSVQKIKRGQ